jgi:D-lactate dehydrogenase (cytochrome)
MTQIRPFGPDYEEYRRDESRSVGEADSISFPTSEDEVRAVLCELYPSRVPVTVQGGRTGLAAGAVPHGGHVLNLSKMNRYLGLRRDQDGTFYLRVQPGLVLSQLRKDLEDKNIPTAGWDEESLAVWEALKQAPEQIFPTDPTEISACMGGIVACNASGARSFLYGPARPHVSGLRVVLADGDLLDLRRGQVCARGRSLALVTEAGRTLELDLPTYQMPHTKNASGYYAADDMDAVDLFVGSDGTLGVITQIEVALCTAPAVTWGVSCFFAQEADALTFTEQVRDRLARAEGAPARVVAVEYFDAGALDILRRQKAQSTAFAGLQPVPERFGCCVYVELAADGEDRALEALYLLGGLLGSCGGSEEDTWVARTALDREQQRFFRHAVPESTNMLIDERRKADPTITKLGSDMSVPDERLRDVVELYRRTLAEEGLQTAVWGHIGNNHLHVNVLPRDAGDYARGKALYQRWAAEVTRMGGAVSAEHGVGKLKRGFLATMYGDEAICQMARLKLQLDPAGVLGRGNLVDPALLDALIAENPAQAQEA